MCIICQKHKLNNPSAGGAIFEDNEFFLSHHPLDITGSAHLGHLLLEPKRHIESHADLDSVEFKKLGLLFKSAHAILFEALNPVKIYTFSIGEKVPHLHFHFIPRYSNTPPEFWGTKIMDYSGHHTTDSKKIDDLVCLLKSKISLLNL